MWKKWAVSLCLGMGFVPWASAQAAGPTIDEVWMQHGGARLYYDALMEPQQMNLKGARRKDPALMHNLPPIVEVKPQSTRRKRSTSAAAKPPTSVQATAPATTGLPAGQAVSPKPSVEAAAPAPAPAPVPAPVKTNGSAAMQTPPAPGSSGTGAATGTGASVNGAGKASPGSLLPAQSTRDVFVPPPASPAVPPSQSGGMGAGTTGSATGAGSATRTAGAGESNGAAASAPRPNIPAGARP